MTKKSKLDIAIHSLNPDAWEVAKLRAKGFSYQELYQKFNGVYSIEDISYMVKQVAECNKIIALDNPDLIRQALIDEIDMHKAELLLASDGVMNDKVFAAMMKTIEMKAKLLGVNAPERQEIDIVATINSAGEALTDKLNMWRKARGSKVIDVTPEEETQIPIPVISIGVKDEEE